MKQHITQYFSNLANRSKSLFFSMSVTNGFRRQMTSTLMLLYFISLGHDASLVALMFGIARSFLLVFEFPSGTIADHHSRKKSVLLSFFLMSLAFFGLYCFNSFWLLSVAFILHDVAWAFQSGISTAWIIDNLNIGDSKKKMASFYAHYFFFEKSGRIIGGLAGLLIVAISFKAIWLVIAILNFLMFLTLLFFMEEKNFFPIKNNHGFIKKIYVQSKEVITYLLSNEKREFRKFLTIGFFGDLSLQIFLLVAPLFLAQILGISEANIAGIYGFVSVFVLAGPFLGEKLLSSWNLKRSMIRGSMVIGLAMLIFVFSKSIILSVIGLFLFELSDYALATVFQSATQNFIPSKNRASLSSIVNVLWHISFSIAAGITALSLKILGVVNTGILAALISIGVGFAYLFLKE